MEDVSSRDDINTKNNTEIDNLVDEIAKPRINIDKNNRGSKRFTANPTNLRDTEVENFIICFS